MKHQSLYLDWYVHVPTVKYDFRSSGLKFAEHSLMLGEIDLSANYEHGNPETAKLMAQRYNVRPENTFITSEGASGQNARIIRYLAERNEKKKEAIVEYPTYEPLLRQVQEHFPHVKRLERKEKDSYRLDADELQKVVTEKTGLLIITNPHAPTGATSDRSELKEVMAVANEYGFYVICDEIYAEFDRNAIPTIFSIDSKWGIVTTSFSKGYGLGGLKLGMAIAEKEFVDELYYDILNTIGTSSNIVEIITTRLLTEGYEKLEKHKQRWSKLRNETEEFLTEKGLEYFPNKIGVTYWMKLPTKDTHKWINEHAIPQYSLALVPGTFFLFRNNNTLVTTNKARLGLGNINPDEPNLASAFEALEKSLKKHGNTGQK